jgi:glycerol-3-phosphate acyltransferase PlsY
MTALAVVAAASFLVGGVPFSYLAGRLARGIDLREHGSGNLGASNVFRILGSRWAIAVLVLDVVKGFAPVVLAGRWGAGLGVDGRWLGIVAAGGAILGHLFSPYLRFSGGKGIATSAGAFLALQPWAFVGAFSVWAAVFAWRRIMSLASLCGAVSLPILVYATGRLGIGDSHWSLLAASSIIMAVVVAKHRSNIRRLLRGTEAALSRKKG